MSGQNWVAEPVGAGMLTQDKPARKGGTSAVVKKAKMVEDSEELRKVGVSW